MGKDQHAPSALGFLKSEKQQRVVKLWKKVLFWSLSSWAPLLDEA